MSPTEDIVPITYMSGTGGNFLCHFIVSAKRNIKTVIKLSEHGNAHKGNLKDISGPPYGPSWNDQNKINFLMIELEQKLNHPTNFFTQKPFYTCSHIVDINLISIYFNKFIRITYDIDDSMEVAIVFYGKWHIDQRNQWMSEGNEGKLNEFKPSKLNLSHTLSIKRFQSKFTKLENMPNVLFISWKELFKGNIEELITKISTFTDINPDNFSRESLIHWRTKTQYCIDTFSETK
jgi:hypothetical protein